MAFIVTLFKRFMFFILLAGLVYLIWWYVTPWINKPIRDVLVTGEYVPKLVREHLKKQLLEKELEHYFTINITAVKNIAKSSVWIDEARVARVWPDRIVVEVTPPVFVARWGDDAFLNSHWQVEHVEPQLVPQYTQLPTLIGPVEQSFRMAKLFSSMSAILAREQLIIDTFTMADRGAIDIVLDNQVKVLLGREKVQKRLQRIVDLYGSDLIAEQTNISSIDGRYDHGIAVKLKPL